MTDNIERGAAEENSGTPVTPTETDASRTPPSRSGSDRSNNPAESGDQHDSAESASNTDV